MAPSKDENELKGTFLVMESGASSDVTLAKMMQTNKTNNTHVSSSLPSSPASPTYIHCNSSEIFYIKKLSLPVEDQGFDIISSSSRSSPSSLKPNIIKVPLSSSASLSSDSFVNGSTNQALTSSSAEEENKKLNLHLGLPFEPRKIKLFRLVCKMMSFFLELVEDYLYTICDKIPLSLRQTVEYICAVLQIELFQMLQHLISLKCHLFLQNLFTNLYFYILLSVVSPPTMENLLSDPQTPIIK